ncbi:MAG: NAD-dependent epimerase/dehydratase family protein [Gemmatimonadales bacterium]
MTSLRAPYETAVRGLVSLPDWHRALTRFRLREFQLRSTVKVALDFSLSALAAGIAIVLQEGVNAFRGGTVWLAAGVGLLYVTAHAAQGSYRSIWRYTSLREAVAITRSSAVVLMALLAARWLGFTTTSGSTLLLITLLLLFFCVGVRAWRRWQAGEEKRHPRSNGSALGLLEPRRVLIAGAGEHGLSIGRDILKSGLAGVDLVGFLDDDPAKIGAALNGARVLGPLRDVLAIAEQHQVSEVIVAMPSADSDLVQSFIRRVEDVGLRVRAVRGIERFVMGRDLHRPGTTTMHELLNGAKRSGGGGNGRDPGGRHDRRRVLVTGGAGFIGAHLTRMLLDQGYQVRVLDRFDYGRSGLEAIQAHPRLEVLQGDICNSRDVSRAVRDVDGVLALAAIVGDPACNLDPDETINLNYTATKILVETSNFYGVRRLVFASSCSVYGASDSDLLTERSRLNPVSLYARTRVLSENILFDRRGDVEPVVLRLATVFGLSPRMRFDLVVNTLTARAVVDRRIAVFGGNQWRPNVHCRDVARAFILTLEAPAAAVAGEIFNVGGDALNHRIAELGEIVARIVGDVTVEQHDEVPDPRNYRVTFAKIHRTLGFVPEYTVAAGIREVAAAVRGTPMLQHHQHALFHNVQAFKQSLAGPRRRRDDLAPAAAGA